MDNVKDQIKILERMLTSIEIRNFNEKETADFLCALASLLGMMNNELHSWILKQEEKGGVR